MIKVNVKDRYLEKGKTKDTSGLLSVTYQTTISQIQTIVLRCGAMLKSRFSRIGQQK